MLDSCNCALFLEIVFPTKLLEIANLAVGKSVILPCGCQSAAFRRFGHGFGSGGKGTRTPDIQLAKLALYQLSYAPMDNLQFTIDD